MSKTLFDHVNHIFEYQTEDYWNTLTDADKKTFQPYMVHRIISMNRKYLPIVNEIQRFGQYLTPKDIYRLYSQLLPKGKEFNKYIKRKDAEIKFEYWLIMLIADYFSVSRNDAEDYLTICYKTEAGKEDIRGICEKFGTDPKLIKKAKLA